jgi:hypothetical protein
LIEGSGTGKHCESKRERVRERGGGEKERYRLETEGKEMERVVDWTHTHSDSCS